MDPKNKKQYWIIGGVVFGFILLTATGLLMWVMASNNEPKPPAGAFETNTPNATKIVAPGSIRIDPSPIVLQLAPDGLLKGQARIYAVDSDFTVGTFSIEGDPTIRLNADECPKTGAILRINTSCGVIVSLKPNALAAPATPNILAIPMLHVTGNSKTPGGDPKPIDMNAEIKGSIPGQSTAIDPAAIGALPGTTVGGPVTGNPALTSGTAGNVQPYGPVQAVPGGTAPPVDYTQTPVQQQQILSPREQFIIARRQAVLGNIVARQPQQANQNPNEGTWDEINIPKAMSSYPQDMSRVVTMDRIITAVIARPYDSRSSQQVVAQVDRNVYGASGRNVLIPRGSTLIGVAAGGAERVAISWNQLIRPDGARFVMTATSGDAMGQAGVPGYVNERLLKRYGSILMGTIFKAGTARFLDAQEQPSAGTNIGGTGTQARNNGAIVTDIVRGDIETIVNDIIQKNSNVVPIITVPAGTRITIVPTHDLVMRPVKREVIVRQSYPRQMNGGAPVASYQPNAGGNGGNGGNNNDNGDVPQIQMNSGRDMSGRQRQNSTGQALDNASKSPPVMSSTPPWSDN